MTYAGLQFQPRLIGIVVAIGTIAQSPAVFIALGAVLFWNAALPRWNVFDLVYNRFFAVRSGIRLAPAPAPRRFAQSLAGAMAVSIGGLLMSGHRVAAFTIDAILILAIVLLVFGGFCLGSYVFHVITGRVSFAHRTMPWS